MNAVEIVKQMYAYYAADDLDSVMKQCSDDMHYDWPCDPRYSTFNGCAKGRDAVAQRLNDLKQQFIYHAVTPIAIFGSEDRVAAQMRFVMTHRASNERLHFDAAHLWTIRDGKATELIEFYDSALIAEAERIGQQRASAA